MKHVARLTKLVSPFFLIILFTSCTPTISESLITDSNKRFEYEKFSILPPKGDNWYLVLTKIEGDKVLTVFAKKIDPTSSLGLNSFQPHTIRATLRALGTGNETFESQEEFLDMVKKSEREGTSERFNVLKETYTLHTKVGEYCVLLDKLSEDTGVPNDPGNTYLFEQYILYCFDRASRIFVAFGCTQRAPEMEGMVDLKQDCDPFLNSLIFIH